MEREPVLGNRDGHFGISVDGFLSILTYGGPGMTSRGDGPVWQSGEPGSGFLDVFFTLFPHPFVTLFPHPFVTLSPHPFVTLSPHPLTTLCPKALPETEGNDIYK